MFTAQTYRGLCEGRQLFYEEIYRVAALDAVAYRASKWPGQRDGRQVEHRLPTYAGEASYNQ